jgi:hypothetical protein
MIIRQYRNIKLHKIANMIKIWKKNNHDKSISVELPGGNGRWVGNILGHQSVTSFQCGDVLKVRFQV